ncbi:MAG: tetratricopeptide repeat protein [Mobilitalea sp.]
MLRGAFRTKEGRIIAAILGFVAIIVGIFVMANYSQDKKFEEQAVMAENFLKAGSYEQAAEAYLKAISMKNSDQQLLTIGLSEAYIGLNDYDKALEVLRSCYQKTSGIKIKEKIEEVTSEKTDYEYLQSISRADVYFTNKEYAKAITEYEKAKSIKSKEILSYKRITEAYIELGEYALAHDQVLEGQELTQSGDLAELLVGVDFYLMKEQYNTIVTQAAEYIYQENYEDGIAKYKEAILLLPSEEKAYQGLAETYLAQENYNLAVSVLQNALQLVNSAELEDLYKQASELKEIEDERDNILLKLYNALENKDYTQTQAIMNLTSFKERIAIETPIYYGDEEGDISKGYGMIIYDFEKVYFGDIKDGIKKGVGIYFMLTESNLEQGYYCYEGEWNNDIPNGAGKTAEVNILSNETDGKYVSKTVTEGNYDNATENGIMKKIFYTKDEETGWVSYTARNGIPMPSSYQIGQPTPAPIAETYEIGELYLGDEPTGEYYSVKPQTMWGVKPFIKN